MENNIITESQVREALDKVLNEEVSKIPRQDFNRVQYKIEELQNSLNDAIREFKKLEDSIPSGLKTSTNKKLALVSSYLFGSKNVLNDLKDKVSQAKKISFTRQIEEKK